VFIATQTTSFADTEVVHPVNVKSSYRGLLAAVVMVGTADAVMDDDEAVPV
jgi:hypothetical protein